MRALIATLALLAACGADPIAIPPECNGRVELCERRYDEIAYPTTHNAMSNAEDGWTEPNQNRNLEHQLEDGVRGFMLDAHLWDGEPFLCHAICALGMLPLADGLGILEDFLHTHRGEVITIIFESYVSADDMATAFADSGLDRLVHVQSTSAPWPTLRELVDLDERVVVLTDDTDGGALPWYLDEWAHAFENPYAAASVDEFSCDVNRGDGANPVFIFNHFLTQAFAVPEQADTVNASASLLTHAEQCRTERAKLPNFVTVDFYDQGDLFGTVDALNGF